MSCKCLYITLFLPLFCACVYGDTNILVNPGFEDGINRWSGRSCPIEAVTSPVHSGSGSARAYGRTDTWQGIRQSLLHTIVDGKTYQISAWVRVQNPSSPDGDTIAVSMEQQDNSGTHYHNVASVTATDKDWTQITGDFTLHVEGTLFLLDVYFEGPGAGIHFFVDDVNVYGPARAASQADTPAPAEPKATGVIDVNVRHQIIEGFGAAGAHYTRELVNHKKKAELYDLLFKGLGLDIFRIRNNYDMEPNSFKETVEIVKAGEAALGRDLKVLMSSWSPPVRLKSNDRTVSGTLKKKDGTYMYAEFAWWWYDSLTAYDQNGVTVDYISIQNEPDFLVSWDSCRFEPTETTDMAGYETAFETVWQTLHTRMGSAMPRMLAPETSGLGRVRNYISHMDDLSHVYGYAHHLYNCSGDGDEITGCGAAPDLYLVNMKDFQSEYGNKPLFQTEFEHQPGTWADAINTAILIHNALTAENVSAYLYWELFWGPGTGLVSMDDASSYSITSNYYTFKHYSAFIHADWQRVEASTENTGLRISAYISPDNQKLSIVIINISQDTDISLDCSLKGFSALQGMVYRTSRTENCVHVGNYEDQTPWKLPAYSITTLCLTAGNQ
jgi:glucuronoarabinoxylan endo-1,4-beta-xylanase